MGACVSNDSDVGASDNDCVGSSVGVGVLGLPSDGASVSVDGSDGDSEDDVTASDGVVVG